MLSAILLSAALIVPIAGCGGSGDKDSGKLNFLKENIIDDHYDNYYEIFVYSFCDSDGDGVGDLNGVAQKLDYIRDMGYTAIWLMPINDSPSYHGYDVRDYYKINSKYGTMADYENLLSKAHKKGIKVIMDLVVNHSSSENEWFKQSSDYQNGLSEDDTYADWYNYSTSSKTGYHKKGSIYYEGQFSPSMPDLNLDSEGVRAEIENIMKFWLEKGTDGFRLDGVLYYYTGNRTKSIEFCTWLKNTAIKYNDDAYIVGEMWDNMSTSSLELFYTSGLDSFFYFPSHGPTGNLATSVRSPEGATVYWNSLNRMIEVANGYIPAPFLGNHDTGRIAGIMSRDIEDIKFAYGLLSMYNGNTFTYYGDEIGMLGSKTDPDKRIGMLWDNAKTGMTNAPPGCTSLEYVFDGVKEQLADENSILNYYKLCNNARNAFPAIMRGTVERVNSNDEKVLIFKKTYNNESVTIAINFDSAEKTVEVKGTLAQQICVSGAISQNGTSLTMPAKAIAILK